MNYWFDSRDCIAKVDESWLAFAVENGAAHLTSDAVTGTHLSSFISDSITRDLWARLLARARSGAPVAVTIRCDAPECRRTISLRMKPDRRRVRVTSTVLAREYRERMPLLEKVRACEGPPLVACSWCRRFELAGRWVEVEALVEALHLFTGSALPPVVDSTCPACLEAIGFELERGSADA